MSARNKLLSRSRIIRADGGGAVSLWRIKRIDESTYGGCWREREVHYAILRDAEGWRIDEVPPIGPREAVNGPDRKSHWRTMREAAAVLGQILGLEPEAATEPAPAVQGG